MKIFAFLVLPGISLLVASCTTPTATGPENFLTPTLIPVSATPTAFEAVLPSETPSAIQTPEATPTQYAGCAGGLGSIEATTYPGAIASGQIPVRVYLPACYNEGERRFPVVYVFHGKPFTETHWETVGAINLLSAKIEAGDWPPVLLVMPLLPEPQFSNTDGGPSSYEGEFVEGLMPFIDSNYKTLASAEYRAVAGISRGGIWALEIGLSREDLIQRIAGLSPSLAVNYPRPEFDPFNMTVNLESPSTLVYLSAGDSDWARAETERLGEVMNREGVSNVVQIVIGGHENATWTASLTSMFDFLLAGWPSS